MIPQSVDGPVINLVMLRVTLVRTTPVLQQTLWHFVLTWSKLHTRVSDSLLEAGGARPTVFV
jgi:hypothetical protein